MNLKFLPLYQPPGHRAKREKRHGNRQNHAKNPQDHGKECEPRSMPFSESSQADPSVPLPVAAVPFQNTQQHAVRIIHYKPKEACDARPGYATPPPSVENSPSQPDQAGCSPGCEADVEQRSRSAAGDACSYPAAARDPSPHPDIEERSQSLLSEVQPRQDSQDVSPVASLEPLDQEQHKAPCHAPSWLNQEPSTAITSTSIHLEPPYWPVESVSSPHPSEVGTSGLDGYPHGYLSPSAILECSEQESHAMPPVDDLEDVNEPSPQDSPQSHYSVEGFSETRHESSFQQQVQIPPEQLEVALPTDVETLPKGGNAMTGEAADTSPLLEEHDACTDGAGRIGGLEVSTDGPGHTADTHGTRVQNQSENHEPDVVVVAGPSIRSSMKRALPAADSHHQGRRKRRAKELREVSPNEYWDGTSNLKYWALGLSNHKRVEISLHMMQEFRGYEWRDPMIKTQDIPRCARIEIIMTLLLSLGDRDELADEQDDPGWLFSALRRGRTVEEAVEEVLVRRVQG